MTKEQYMYKILEFCTPDQQSLFERMYPEGPTKKQIKHAITQVENTLNGVVTKNITLNTEVTALKEKLKNVSDELCHTRCEADKNSSKLNELNLLVSRLQNPENMASVEVQRRLDILTALEAGGVDNWEWYEESLSDHLNTV